ncbi:MAG TPA: acetyl-CoA C-acyltransferase [Sporichthyaceae bacterium]|jgi:acetyl-CoA C-acetyltransferase|nr:acetyl-CoA C-acyltransferase [Sporichthyaceae bacterium]
MEYPVVVSAVRTPLGRRNGGYAGVHPARLLGAVQRAAVETAGVDPALVGQIVGGTVAQVGEQAFNLTRTAWLAEGLPATTAATTVDAQCGSSQQAFTLAAALIAGGVCDVALACGVESMTRLPIGSNFRKDFDLGRPVPQAYQRHYDFLNQFQAAERIAGMYGIDRAAADEFGMTSQRRAIDAWDRGAFDTQLLHAPVEDEQGQAIKPARDEGLREPVPEQVKALQPVVPGGVHTVAASSQISDGASAVLLMSERRAARLGVTPMARVVDSIMVGVDPVTMLLGPHRAVPALLERTGLAIDDLDLIEINEAFASIVLSFVTETKADPAVVNPNGGAIALGHPLGATGCVLATKAVHELAAGRAARALVTMCCGGGLGTATVLERL